MALPCGWMLPHRCLRQIVVCILQNHHPDKRGTGPALTPAEWGARASTPCHRLPLRTPLVLRLLRVSVDTVLLSSNSMCVTQEISLALHPAPPGLSFPICELLRPVVSDSECWSSFFWQNLNMALGLKPTLADPEDGAGRGPHRNLMACLQAPEPIRKV